MNKRRLVITQSGLLMSALLAVACGEPNFPVVPTPVASSAVVLQGTRFQGNITLANGATTSFNMTLIARGLAGGAGALSVTGNFETGTGLKGTVQGILDGTLDNGIFHGSLTANSAGHNEERQYTGPVTTASAAWVPGDCVQNCTADGLASTGAVQAAPASTTAPNAPTPPSPCSYSISPTGAPFPSNGGTGNTTVTTGSNCAWAAEPLVPWITVVGAATGTGMGTVTFTVLANLGDQRSGSLRIAGQTFNVTEASRTSTPTPTPPTITTQPQSQTITSGATTVLSVTAAGTAPLGYQWYVGPTGTTTSPIATATASSYTTPALTSTTSYWVRVANSSGSADSITATITVTTAATPPTITTQPQSQTITSGTTAALSVTATGTAPLSYQWYVGSTGTTTNPIAGATASNYTTPALTGTTMYWVRVANTVNHADSMTAMVTVTTAATPPVITTQPQSQTILPGATSASVTLSVTATGTAPLTYQWYVGAGGTTTSPIQGATASNYTTPALTSTTSYWVRVTQAADHVDSTTATIMVAVYAVVRFSQSVPACAVNALQTVPAALDPIVPCSISGGGGGTCYQRYFNPGTTVTFSISGPGSVSWSGCDSVSGNACIALMNASRCNGCPLPNIDVQVTQNCSANPSITVTQSGSSYTVSGSRFTPNGSVMLYLRLNGGAPTVVASSAATSAGSWTAVIPTQGSFTYTLWAVDVATSAQSNFVVFTIF